MSVPGLISVVIPSYNHRKFISDLLDSIYHQTYKNFEVIVVDDGSSDGSQEFLRENQNKFNYKLVLKQNEGLCATINRGLREIRGEYVVVIASDDVFPVRRLEEQHFIMSSGNYDVISGGMTKIAEDGKEIKYIPPYKTGRIFFKDLAKKNLIYAPTVMFRANVFKKYGEYNTQCVIEDYPMWLKISSGGAHMEVFDKNWAYYRVFKGNLRRKIDWYYEGLFQALKEYPYSADAKRSLVKFKFIYLVKVALLDGVLFEEKLLLSKFDDITAFNKGVLRMIARTPQFVRKYLSRLLIK